MNTLSEIKSFGQVSTPDYIVNFMLNGVGYDGEIILNKHILDNSCGDGAFLKRIVERYVMVARNKKLSQQELKKNLETYVHGIKINPIIQEKCLHSLNSIFPANYDVQLGDALLTKKYQGKMDFIVGNPPYVKIHNLNKHHKRLIFQKQLKGMVNLHSLFYLLSFQQLNIKGKLIYLTPSFFKNASGKMLREKIVREKKLIRVYDFRHQQIFPNITTYPVIALFDNSQESQKVSYSVVEVENNNYSKKVNLVSTNELDWEEIIIGNKFIFEQRLSSESKAIFASKQKKVLEVKNGLATWADNIFIADKLPFTSSDIIKVVKSSTGEVKECIFPYRYDEKNKRYLLKDWEKLDENTRNYLFGFKSQLEARSIKEKDKWWQFGRSQAINDVGRDKFYVNCLFNKEVNNIGLGSASVGIGIYGGLYILPGNISQKEIEDCLKSEEFKYLVKVFGETRNGGYYLINSRVISKYLNYRLSTKENLITTQPLQTLKKQLKKPLLVKCFKCFSFLEIKYNPGQGDYSKKNNWNYWTNNWEKKEKYICNKCLIYLYKEDKWEYLTNITNASRRRVLRTYIYNQQLSF